MLGYELTVRMSWTHSVPWITISSMLILISFIFAVPSSR